MSEAMNYVIWQIVVWLIPVFSGLFYLYCIKHDKVFQIEDDEEDS